MLRRIAALADWAERVRPPVDPWAVWFGCAVVSALLGWWLGWSVPSYVGIAVLVLIALFWQLPWLVKVGRSFRSGWRDER